MDILDFFDVENTEHIKAFDHFLVESSWPKGFIPDNVTFNSNWTNVITAELASAYIDLKLKEVS